MKGIKHIKMAVLAVAAATTMAMSAVPAFAQDFHFRSGIELKAGGDIVEAHGAGGGGDAGLVATSDPQLNFARQGGGTQLNFARQGGGTQLNFARQGGDVKLNFTKEGGRLLLPAVQVAREAARR